MMRVNDGLYGQQLDADGVKDEEMSAESNDLGKLKWIDGDIAWLMFVWE